MKLSHLLTVLVVLVVAAVAYTARHGLPELGPAGPLPVGLDSPAAVGSLDGVRVVQARPSVPGYDRDCGRGAGCVFGPAWSDDVDVDGGHNGCDTRNDVLRRDLTDVALEPDSHGCIVLAGILADPYTGGQVAFDRARDASGVQIDHVVSLATAWDHGAASWDAERRQAFANDPANLLAVTGSVNQSKSDKTPAQWMPEHNTCRFARTYLAVTTAYDLTVSRADARTLEDALATC